MNNKFNSIIEKFLTEDQNQDPLVKKIGENPQLNTAINTLATDSNVKKVLQGVSDATDQKEKEDNKIDPLHAEFQKLIDPKNTSIDNIDKLNLSKDVVDSRLKELGLQRILNSNQETTAESPQQSKTPGQQYSPSQAKQQPQK